VSGSNLREHYGIPFGAQAAHEALLSRGPPRALPAADDEERRGSKHLVSDIVIPLTHAEDHVDVHADMGRECLVLVDERGPFVSGRIERCSDVRQPWNQQHHLCVQTGYQSLGGSERAGRTVLCRGEHVN
jgi:hypothetical protein